MARARRGAGYAVGAAVVLAPLAVVWPSADAALAESSQIYTCRLDGGTSADDTTVAVTLRGMPATVAPGDEVDLDGTLTITLSDGASLDTRVRLASAVGLDSSTFGLVVEIGREPRLLAPRSITAEPTDIGRSGPVEITAALDLPAFTVPSDATGSVVLRMPAGTVAPNPTSGGSSIDFVSGALVDDPDEVAFGGILDTDSPMGGTRPFACWSSTDAGVQVASAVVSTVDEGAPTEVPTDVPTGEPSATAPTGTPAPGALGAPAPAPPPAPAPAPLPSDPPSAGAPPVGTGTAPATPVGLAGVSVTLPFAAVPPSTRAEGVGLSRWALGAVGGLVAAMVLLLGRRGVVRRRAERDLDRDLDVGGI